MPTAPEVTAVIPTRDRWGLLERSLKCVLDQTGVAVEAVVVDDGSREPAPESMEILRDARVRLLRNETSQGVARARNRGVEEARGRWVAFLDDDDLWAPGKLAAQVAAAASADADFVYTGTVWLDGDGAATVVHEAPPAERVARELRGHNVIGGPSSVMAATEAVRAAGGFDPDLHVLADWDMWLRLVESGRPAACPGPLTGYVVHAGSMHQTDMDKVRAEFDRLRRKHRRTGERFGGHEFRVWMAGVYRSTGRPRRAARVHAEMALRDRRPVELVRAVGLLLGEGALRRAGGRYDPGALPARPPTPDWVLAAVAHG